MADVIFEVFDWRQRRYVIQEDIAAIAGRIAAAAAGATPVRTGALAGGFRLVPGQDPGTTLVVNTVPYGRYVEYGTRHRPASAMLGRARAAGG